MVLVAPSLLSANAADLGNEVKLLEKAHADLLHFDVMDGHFVPNMTYGPLILRSLKNLTQLPFDVHLMVNNPENFIPWFIDAGADILTFHLEATNNPNLLIEQIQGSGLKAGVSLRPGTDINKLKKLNKNPDLVLVMGVEPGFGGQPFREDTPSRIIKTKSIFVNSEVLIEVDGGINPNTARQCIEAGADILVAGTAIFKNRKYGNNIRMIRGG